MKQGLIAPSMMCVDFSEMTSVIEAFEKTGIGYLHIDIRAVSEDRAAFRSAHLVSPHM